MDVTPASSAESVDLVTLGAIKIAGCNSCSQEEHRRQYFLSSVSIQTLLACHPGLAFCERSMVELKYPPFSQISLTVWRSSLELKSCQSCSIQSEFPESSEKTNRPLSGLFTSPRKGRGLPSLCRPPTSLGHAWTPAQYISQPALQFSWVCMTSSSGNDCEQ